MKKILILLIIFLSGALSCGELFSTSYDVRFVVESPTSGAKADIEWDVNSAYASDDAILPNTTLPWSDETSVVVDDEGGSAYINLSATNVSGYSADIRVSIYVDDELVDYRQGTIDDGRTRYASYSIYGDQ